MDKLKIRLDFVNINYDRAITWFICLYFSNGLIRLAVRRVLAFAGLQSLYIIFTNLIIYIPLILMLILMFSKRKLDKSLWSFLIVTFTIISLFVLTLFFHPEYDRFFFRETYGIWDDVFRPDNGAVFGFLAVTASKNSKRLIENLKYASFLLLFYSSYQFVKAFSDGYWTSLNAAGEMIELSYNLSFGYTIIFCATIFFGLFIRERKKVYLFLGCLSTVLALVGGSRGCILCLLVFGILYLYKEFSIVPMHKKLLISAGFILLGILFNAFYYDILSELSGIDARTIQMFLSGDITSDNGREVIYSLASEAIKNMPFLGYGAFGDRQFITPYYYWGYCHNIFLEMIIDFGWLLGIIVFLIIGIKSIQVLISARDEQAFVICILLSANAKLFLSDTFWGYPQFWMLIAYLFFVFKEERKKYTEDNNG